MISMSLSQRFLKKMQPPSFILLDDFSELTDQLFCINSVRFASHIADLTDFAKKSPTYESLGLIPLAEIFRTYESFFREVFLKWPYVDIYFLLFPIYREKRQEFIERSEEIKRALTLISSQYSSVHIIYEEAPYEFQGQESHDPYPYHFPTEVYDKFAHRIECLITKI